MIVLYPIVRRFSIPGENRQRVRPDGKINVLQTERIWHICLDYRDRTVQSIEPIGFFHRFRDILLSGSFDLLLDTVKETSFPHARC